MGACPATLSDRAHASRRASVTGSLACGLCMLRARARPQGGLEAVQAANEAKAKVVYDAIAGSAGFFASPVAEAARSLMNIPFTIPSRPELEKDFVAEGSKRGMVRAAWIGSGWIGLGSRQHSPRLCCCTRGADALLLHQICAVARTGRVRGGSCGAAGAAQGPPLGGRHARVGVQLHADGRRAGTGRLHAGALWKPACGLRGCHVAGHACALVPKALAGRGLTYAVAADCAHASEQGRVWDCVSDGRERLLHPAAEAVCARGAQEFASRHT